MNKKVSFLYGVHPVLTLLTVHPERITRLYLENTSLNARQQHIIEKAQAENIEIELVNKGVLDQKTQGVHQGVVADYIPAQTKSEEELFNTLCHLEHPAQLLVLDEVQDPHNLGACLRSAEVFGVDAVIAPKNNAVGLTETVRKVACGAAEMVDYYQVTNLARTLQQIKTLGIWVVGTVINADQAIDQIDWRMPSAIVLGNEQKGIRPLNLRQCDFLVSIPMYGTVSSLNVSVATGILLYESQRQRQGL